ncbi:hypothetical protein BH23ACI1_BH23ACI1_00710 [soil metagenome]
MTLRPLGHGSRVLLAAACLGALCVTLTAQQPPPPRFKTGVEITPVDVTVLDERRRPIRGLTVDDFVVRVDGEIQRIAAFHEVEIPGADKSTAEWTRGAPSDVASNTIEEPRLFVIIMDDVAVPFSVYERNKATEIAHRIIDNLGPRDLAAVIFPEKNHNAQDLTADRTALRRAVETYQPFRGESGRLRSLAVLRKTRQFLHQQLSGHRRAIVYITTGFHVDDSEIAWTLRLDEREKVAAVQSERSATANASRSSYVPIFIFNPEGLLAQGPSTPFGAMAACRCSARAMSRSTRCRENPAAAPWSRRTRRSGLSRTCSASRAPTISLRTSRATTWMGGTAGFRLKSSGRMRR